MKRLATLALAIALASGYGFAQDSSGGDKKDPTPTPEQLQEMKRSLEAQQQQIEKLKKEAADRDKALEEMQKQVQDQQKQVQEQLSQTEAAAVAATQAAEAAKASRRQAPEDLDLEKPGIYKASLNKSIEAMLQQPNPATQMVTPPWAVLKISDNVIFRFGSVIQPTYEGLQDPNSGGYSQNFYLRRARFSVLANLPENITVFFQTDDPRVGYSSNNGQKNINSGFLIQDAYAQWNFLGHAMAIQAGEFLIPTERQVLTSVSTFLALDLPDLVPAGGHGRGSQRRPRLRRRIERSAARRSPDLSHGHLRRLPRADDACRSRRSDRPPAPETRFSSPAASSTTSSTRSTSTPTRARTSARRRSSRSPASTRLRAISRATAATSFFDWPVLDGDAVTAEADYIHYDGHGFVFDDNGTNNTLPEQNSFYANAGFYFCNLKLQPFIRYEFLDYADIVNLAKEQQRIGGGFNYYVYGQNFKIVPYYERVIPKVQPTTAQIKDFNRFVLEMQGSF